MKHKRMTYWLLGFLLLTAPLAMAQRNTVATGGEATGSGGTVGYSVGQIDYTEATGSGGSANLGLQQPFEIFVLGVDDQPNITIEMAVFPNPTQANLTLRLDQAPTPGMRIALYDILGRSLYENEVHFNETIIPMEALASATYILRVSDNYSLLKTFKIIKK
ncbi:T9SS type A sorting domain-containing protein [Aureisphaera galaxeae]|uniref:T9SS type A sorting domain-containing protein n=1 Tax=Aureisphaera galaxeae TaxID=1538023 RepID=UPI0023509B9F|nr:T9SS type A sorting domain-containing protein [Aureisphaera galaxeae]MDC8003371.1 T9SS type A sorting domain-containing protein [Aureisphaera galaxeae]